MAIALRWCLFGLLMGTVCRAASLRTTRNGTYRPLLAVTGFWRMPDQFSNPLDQKLVDVPWNMRIVMKLNVPMAVYGDTLGLYAMKQVRGDLNPPVVSAIEYPIQELVPCATHQMQLMANQSKYTHSLYVPSLSTGCIWAGKMQIVRLTADKNPGYYWYAWVDVGMHAEKWDIVVREGRKPWPDPEKLKQLPKHQVSISRTGAEGRCDQCVLGKWDFCRCVSPTTIVIPAPEVHKITDLYWEKINECLAHVQKHNLEGYPCLSEQVILTQVYLAQPKLFNLVGKSYDRIGNNLTSTLAEYEQSSDLFHFLSNDNDRALTKV